MPDKEKTKLVPASEKRKADDIDQIKDLKKVNKCEEKNSIFFLNKLNNKSNEKIDTVLDCNS